ncbi:MAG: ECF-type sigma factor [Pseudomonadales bacterium]
MAEITQVLGNWAHESRDRKNLVFEALYAQLRRLAGQQLRRQGDGIDLQPTVLVHEAYLRLVDLDRISINGRAHFFGLAGRLMREILVDEARHARAQKRDRALETRLTGEFLGSGVDLDALLLLDQTLTELGELDPDYLWLVDARVFGGLTIEEAAGGLGISPATVKRKWKVARAWITERLKDSEDGALRELTRQL